MPETLVENTSTAQFPITSNQVAREWVAVQTKSRHEKMVARELEAKQVQCYLPVHWVVHRWSDRNKSVLLPLFPGYLFARICHHEQWLVLDTRGVVRILGGSSGPTPIPEKEILDLETLVESQMPIQHHTGLIIGQRVRVIHGPLAGVEGILQKCKKGHRLAVTVRLLGRSVTVEINDCDVVSV